MKKYWDIEQTKLKEHYFYKDDKLHGLLSAWYLNGQIRCKCNYTDGVSDGFSEYWYENGQKSEEAYHVNGLLCRLYKSWYYSGDKRVECWYVEGIEYKSQEEFEESLIANKAW